MRQRRLFLLLVVYCPLEGGFVVTLCFPSSCVHVSQTQLDGNSQQLRRLDDAVSRDEDGVKKSDGGNSCEDDEEGHLIYHIGLLMKERCM